MQKRHLGPHSIGAIGFGAMSFGGMYGPTDRAESLSCLDAAWEAGLTHFDTANIYGMGLSEDILGEWLKTRGHRPILATKAGIVSGPPRSSSNAPGYLRAELEASLKRLGRDHVEIFYLHRREADRPLAEVLGTISDLIAEGKIGGYGLSEIAPATLRAAHAILPPLAVQSEYSLWTRQPELGLLQACAALDVAFVAFSPLGRGIFSDQPLAPVNDSFRAANPRFNGENFAQNQAFVQKFRDFANSRGYSTSALALAWIMTRGPNVIPLPGTRKAAHLRSFATAAQIRLTPPDLAEIDKILPIGFAAGDRYSDEQINSVERYC